MRAAPVIVEIEQRVRTSPVVGMDETTIRQDGALAWAWPARTDQALLFRIEVSRGAWVAEAMLGQGFKGVVCSDLYGVYTRMGDWAHGYCNAHTIRDAKKITEVTSDAQAARFSNRLRSILSDGQKAQRSGDTKERDHVRRRMDCLVGSTRFEHLPDVGRLQKRLDDHRVGILLFVDRPDVPMTNNASERDIRPFALQRKVTGGTRSSRGSFTVATNMSVTQTLRKNGLPLRAWTEGAFEAHIAGRAPPSVFAAPDRVKQSPGEMPRHPAAGAASGRAVERAGGSTAKHVRAHLVLALSMDQPGRTRGLPSASSALDVLFAVNP